jgi:hypothetical protein
MDYQDGPPVSAIDLGTFPVYCPPETIKTSLNLLAAVNKDLAF